MALTRKFLQAMGIEAEKVDEIINAHRDTVDGLKEELDAVKQDAAKLPDVQKELDKAKKQIADNEEADGKDKWKVKYDAMKEEYDKYKSDITAKETKQKKTDAYRALLKESGVSEKRIDAVLKVTDLDAVELDDEGKVKDAEGLRKTIKEEWADFITKDEKKGAETDNPPAGGNGGAEQHQPSRAAQVAQKRYEMLYGKQTEGENK